MGEINFSNPRKLVLNSYYPEIYDPANLKFKELELEDSIIEDSETALKLDFSKILRLVAIQRWLNLDLNIVHEKLMWIKINHSTDDRTMADFNPSQLSWPFPGQVFSQQANPALVYALQNQTDSLTLDGQETYLRITRLLRIFLPFMECLPVI